MRKLRVLLPPVSMGFVMFFAVPGCVEVRPLDVGEPSVHDNNEVSPNKTYEEEPEKGRNNPDIMVLPGLVADRKTRQVVIQAEATGLDTQGNPPEFFLIGQHSGHGYEALAVSRAKPGDIHKALLFIGMEPGRPVNVSKLQLWPKGERVVMTFAGADTGKPFGPVRVESMFLDGDTKESLKPTGLIFTGSVMIDSLAEPGKKVYAADAREPGSIASNYNESESVLDVPWQATKATVYGHSVVNPEFVLPTNQLLSVTIEPEYKDGKKRVMDLTLEVSVSADDKGDGKLAFQLVSPDGKVVNKGNDAANMIDFFRSVCQKGHDPFVTLRPDMELTTGALGSLCTGLASIESASGIRIEPPPQGHLFYKAFIPEDRYRDRAARHAQPWELHFTAEDSGHNVTLTQVEQIWKDTGELKPELKATDYDLTKMAVDQDITGPESLRKLLDEKGPGLPVIFVFTPPTLTYGQLMAYLKPVLPTHGIVYVYVN